MPFNFDSNYFDSPLDSLLIINLEDPIQPPTVMYAGKSYGWNAGHTQLPNPICYNSGGQYACETQFDCGKEVNMGDFEGGKQWRETMIWTEEFTTDDSKSGNSG